MGSSAQNHSGPGLESQDRGVGCRRSEQYSHLGHLAAGKHTVGKWRQRFATQRVDSPLDEPRSGAPLRIGDEQVTELIDRALYQWSRGAVHWNQRTWSRPMRYRARRLGEYGERSACIRTGLRPSSSRPIRCLPTRCAMSCGLTWHHSPAPWLSAWTRNTRFRNSSARSHCYRSGSVRRGGALTSMPGTVQPFICRSQRESRDRHRAVLPSSPIQRAPLLPG